MRPLQTLMIIAVAVLLSPPPSSAAAADATPPRYDLPIGRQLVYSSAGESRPTKGDGSEMSTAGTWRATVVGENPDGSRRVILRSASSYTQKSGGGEHKSPERVQLGYADVFTDGRIKPNPSLGMQLDPSTILPLLPKEAGELASGWEQVDAFRGHTDTFTAAPNQPDVAAFTFTAVRDGVINKIYLTTQKTTYHFTRDKAIITRIESEHAQDWGFHSKGTGTTKLESDTMIPS